MPGKQDLFDEEQIKAWKALHDELGVEIKKLLQKQAALEKMLEGASVFVNADIAIGKQSVGVGETPLGGNSTHKSMIGAIKDILSDAPSPLTHKQIKSALKNNEHFERKLRESPTYYYVVLKRLVDGGDVVKCEDGKTFQVKETVGA